jgi:hypothetical protein
LTATLPLCLAMLICDGLYVDRISERVTILGVFEETRASRYPARHAPFSVYCELSGGRGRIGLVLELRHIDPATFARESIATASVDVDFASLHRSVGVSFEFESLPLEEEGEYVFSLCSGSEVIAERWLLVTE